MRVTFVVFTDCDSRTRSIFTNPGSMEADEYGQTRGARFVAVRLEVVAVAGLMWISWCVFGGAGFFLVFQVTLFFQTRARVHDRWLRETQTVVSVDQVNGLRQSANPPIENSRPSIPTRCTINRAPT